MLTAKAPSDMGVYRVARRTTGVFDPTNWRYADPDDGTFGGRFDDPRGQNGRAPEDRFRVIYCATERVCALAETLSSHRTPIRLLQNLISETSDDDEAPDESLEGTYDPDDFTRGIITYDWRNERQIGHTILDSSLRFADITTVSSFGHLRHALADVATELNFEDIDLSSLTSGQRQLTQQCARHIYELVGDNGVPLFAGIRFLSHLDAQWECWAIFNDRISHVEQSTEKTIYPDDTDLLRVAHFFDLTIEVFGAHYIRP